MVLSPGAKFSHLFRIQRKGFMSMGASRQPTQRLVHSHWFIRSQWSSLSRIRHLGTPGEVVSLLETPPTVTAFWRAFWELTVVYAPTAIFAMWIPGPLSAERAGTLALQAASPRTNARTLIPARPVVPSAALSS